MRQETLAQYRERQAREWLKRNETRLRREFWERKAQCYPVA